ncbi:ORF C287, putative [Babesia caballi]|uniref:ORF C287, putative n=1 Tax=Babesia caballi TaxID=5871 RepID=A0AAV4LY58_BABCB|nr:ORF C287, putative [Babesia caballi]
MFAALGDDADIRRQLEESLGLASVPDDDDVHEELEPLEPESDRAHRRRGGVGFQAAKKPRVFSAEESKLKEVLKGKKGAAGAKQRHQKAPKKPVQKSPVPEEEEEPSRLDLILAASRNRKAERKKALAKRLGKT